MNDKVKKPVALTDDENVFIKDFVAKYENEKTLSDVQRVLLNRIKQKNETSSDIKTLKSLIRTEKLNQKALDIANADKKREQDLIDKQDKVVMSTIRQAVSDKKMLTPDLSYKQVLKLIVGDSKLFTDFLKNAPDVDVNSSSNATQAV